MNFDLFLAGFAGAVAPEIIRLYRLRRQPQTFAAYYFGISLIHALLGGYVATIAPGVVAPWWAFCVGAGLNAVVSTAARWGGDLAAAAGDTRESTAGAGAAPRKAGSGSGEGPLRRFFRAF